MDRPTESWKHPAKIKLRFSGMLDETTRVTVEIMLGSDPNQVINLDNFVVFFHNIDSSKLF